MDLFDLSGKVAIVTGSSRGIGRAIAEAFAEAGARVYVVDVDDKAGEAVASGIRERGGRASFVACDVTDAASVEATFARIVGEAGRLDVLVNCAGGFWKQLSVEETPEDEWDNVIDLNLKSIFLCAKAAIPTFKRQHSGRIVNVGSMAGVSALTMSSPPYSAAKAGVHSLTRVLAFELGEHGVTANALAPGTTATERVVAVRSQAQRDTITWQMWRHLILMIAEIAQTPRKVHETNWKQHSHIVNQEQFVRRRDTEPAPRVP